MGNEAMYLRLFGHAVRRTTICRGWATRSTAGDLTGAFEAAHTLKGVAGNLGLTPLYEAVCAIVEPLRSRAGADYRSMYRSDPRGVSKGAGAAGQFEGRVRSMEQKSRLPPNRWQQVLDNAPVAIFVSAVESRELLYANRLARELLLQLDGDGGSSPATGRRAFRSHAPFAMPGR